MAKKQKPRSVTVSLPEPAMDKLTKLAQKVVPVGDKANASLAVRRMLEKEKL